MPNFTKTLNLEKPLREEFYTIDKHNENSDKIDLAIEKITVPTIEHLKNMIELQEGDTVDIQGYYTAGDGAHHKRKIENEDDGSGIQLANELWANIVHSSYVDAVWFGAKQEVSFDNTDIVKKALLFSITKKTNFKITKGDYNFYKSDNSCCLGIEIEAYRTLFDFCDSNFTYSGTSKIETFIHFKSSGYVSVENLNIDCALNVGVGVYFGEYKLSGSSTFINNSTVNNIRVFKATDVGIKVVGWMTKIVRCVSDQSRNIGFEILSGTSVILDNCWSRQAPNVGFHIHTNQLYSSAISCGCDGAGETGAAWNQRTKVGWKFGLVQGFTMTQCGSEQIDKVMEAENALGLFVNGHHMLHVGSTLSNSPTNSIFEFFKGGGWMMRGITTNNMKHFNKMVAFNSVNGEYGAETLEILDNSVSANLIDQTTNTSGYNYRAKKMAYSNRRARADSTRIVKYYVKSYEELKGAIDAIAEYGHLDLPVVITVENSFQIPLIKIKNVTGSELVTITGKTGTEIINFIEGHGIYVENCSSTIKFKNLTLKGGVNSYSMHIQANSSNVIAENVKFETTLSGWTISAYNSANVEQKNCTTVGVFHRGEYTTPFVVKATDNSVGQIDGQLVNEIKATFISSLDTPYYTLKMQQEGIYDDFIAYMDEQHEYEQSQKQAVEGVATMNELVEPQPSQTLINFKEKYLG